MPKKVIRQQKQKNRDEMKKDFHNSLNVIGKSVEIVTERFGPDGKMFDAEGDHPAFLSKDEYDKIKIDIPEGLDENMVTAVVMGSIMRPDRLSDRILSSGSSIDSSNDILGFNRTFVMENLINGDRRQGEFVDLLPKARQEAKDALIDYGKGKKDAVNKMLKDFMDAGISSSRKFGRDVGYKPNQIRIPEYCVVQLAAKLIDDPNMPPMDGISEIDRMRLKNHVKMQNAVDDYIRAGDKLLNSTPPAGSEERKKLAEEFIFNRLLANIGQQEIKKGQAELNSELVGGMLKKIGVEPADVMETETDFYKLSKNPGVMKATIPILDTYQKYHISDIQAILAEPDGKEKLMQVYGDAIRNSDHYKEIVEAADSNALSDVLDSYSSGKSFEQEYPDIKVPKASAQINKNHKAAYDKEMAVIEKNVVGKAIDSGVLYNIDRKKYGINSTDPDQMKKNADIIKQMYKDLNKTDSWYKRSSETFRNLKKELKGLSSYAKKLADTGREPTEKELAEYERKARKVNALTEKYINNKVVNGNYAQKRVTAVSNIRRHLGANLKSVLTSYENKLNEKDEKLMDDINNDFFEKERPKKYLEHTLNVINSKAAEIEDVKKKSDAMALSNDSVKNVFRGEKWKNADLAKVNNPFGYSIDRTGAYGIAIAAMAAEGKYTLKELTDPNFKQQEKAEKFNEVMQHIQGGTKEDQKWIAENIYKGQKEMLKIVDKEVKNIDFTNPDYKKNEKWLELKSLSYAYFDTWQEMSHCEDEIMPLVQAEMPQIKKYDEYTNLMSLKMGPVMDLKNSDEFISTYTSQMAQNHEVIDTRGSSMVTNLIQEKLVGNLIKETKESNPKVPYSEQFLKKENAEKLQALSQITFNEKVDSLKMDFAMSQDTDKVLGKFLDGSALKDVKAVFDPKKKGSNSIKITGLPTIDQVMKDLKYETMDQLNTKEIDRLKDKSVLKLEKQEDKASPIHKAYLEKAENAVESLSKMIKDKTPLTGNNRDMAREYIKNIFAEKMVGVLEKIGVKFPENSSNEIENTINNLPQFKKATEYIGTGTIAEFAFEDKATELIKSSMKDIEKSINKAQDQKELQQQKEMGRDVAADNRALNM